MTNTLTVGLHTVRRGCAADIPRVMELLDAHWEKGCLLSRDRFFFEYEFVVDGKANFCVAEHRDENRIDAFLGFIQTSQRTLPDAFSSMWIARPKCGTRFLGLFLVENCQKMISFRRCAATSLKIDTAVPLSQHFFKNAPLLMQHFYRLAPRDEYRIAVVSDGSIPSVAAADIKLVPLPTMKHVKEYFSFNTLPDQGIYKDAWYFRRRYFEHPYYRFNVWGLVSADDCCRALLVCRVVTANGASALRVVDYFGDSALLPGLGSELDLIMKSHEMEYTDLYCLGIAPELLFKAGFKERTSGDPNIIPNHFEPYEKSNVDIWVSGYWFTKKIGMRLFKGDGDQGRPKQPRLPQEWLDTAK